MSMSNSLPPLFCACESVDVFILMTWLLMTGFAWTDVRVGEKIGKERMKQLQEVEEQEEDGLTVP